MISRSDLRRIAQARLQDARALRDRGRYDGAVYLCGYAVEVALKARICQTLRWPGFPSTNREFEGKQSFRTHDLDLLLNLTAVEAMVRSRYAAEWSIVSKWMPEQRYEVAGSTTRSGADDMIAAAGTLVRVLCRNY
jgi:HEPN domain-containing protein